MLAWEKAPTKTILRFECAVCGRVADVETCGEALQESNGLEANMAYLPLEGVWCCWLHVFTQQLTCDGVPGEFFNKKWVPAESKLESAG